MQGLLIRIEVTENFKRNVQGGNAFKKEKKKRWE